jgi:hypothetical protein
MVGHLYWVNVRLSPSPNFIDGTVGGYKFQYFPHSLIKLSDFCVIGPSNLRATNGYKCSLSIRSKGATQKIEEENES